MPITNGEHHRLLHWKLVLPAGTAVWSVRRHNGEIVGHTLDREVVVSGNGAEAGSSCCGANHPDETIRNLELTRTLVREQVMRYNSGEWTFYFRLRDRKLGTPCYCGGEGVADFACGKPVVGKCGSLKCKYKKPQ